MADEKNSAPARKKTHAENLAILAERTQKAKAATQAAQVATEETAAKTPAQMFLPGFDIGAMPNHLNRSSFIAPIARGLRKFHRQAVMVSRADCVLEYTGEQLDEADGEIIMALIAFAITFIFCLFFFLFSKIIFI